MKTETMTPRWVVENFLPDYEKRYREERKRYEFVEGSEASNPEFVHRFIRRFFPEALSELLKEQRWICADIADYHLESDPILQDYPVINVNEIRDAHIPEPKNRK